MLRLLADEEQADIWRVSSGTAAVLGLQPMRLDAAPTTAYLMLGERCRRACAFCAQARTSSAPAGALSRVIWPMFDVSLVMAALERAEAAGNLQRTCFQVTATPDAISRATLAVRRLHASCALPICVSIAARSLGEVTQLLDAGAERVTLSLDAATPEVFATAKDGSWSHTATLLESGARAHPGRIGTHLIVGLGETEREMVTVIQRMADLGVSIGLFAFTPVVGTAWAHKPAPALDHYRRIQAALWLIVRGETRAERLSFDADDRLCGFGLAEPHLRVSLDGGRAFQTSGCPGCNRPYYNERPGGVMYNYPRPLTPDEARTAYRLATGG